VSSLSFFLDKKERKNQAKKYTARWKLLTPQLDSRIFSKLAWEDFEQTRPDRFLLINSKENN